jgi:DNA mismatch repair protein MutS
MKNGDAQKLTPLMQQYWDIKSNHMDKILLFRMGDFYEMFFDDAVKAAPILSIALTSRNKSQGQDVPMCGVPYHSIGPQINKLLEAGLKVAICDQVENPKDAKTIVRRAVTRVVTPGLVYDPATLDAAWSHYVAAIVVTGEKTYSLAAVDASTGEIISAPGIQLSDLSSWLEKLNPKEVLLAPDTPVPLELPMLLTYRSLGKGQSAESFLLEYVKETQGEDIAYTLKPAEALETRYLRLSATTMRHLELFKTSNEEKEGSLCWNVDYTKTPMGARLLKKRLASPWADLGRIRSEQNLIASYYGDSLLRKTLREKLGTIGDLERKIAKLSNPLCNSRDLRALGVALMGAVEVLVQAGSTTDLNSLKEAASSFMETLQDELPVGVKEGGMIRAGFDPALDEFVDLCTHAQGKLAELENRERSRTGIQSLKVKYNSVYGYSIEITKANLERVPSHFVRRQTLTGAERFITSELSDLEQKIMTAQQKRYDLEYEIFSGLKRKMLLRAVEMLRMAAELGELDLRISWAQLAFEQNYCKPEFHGDGIILEQSRHLVLERTSREPFVPNDISLATGHCLLLTGPNMAGKSTLMRQVALTAILAQCGAYVPANRAVLPLFDQIFTRIGASDNLSRGLSTFMVEMTETAEIINAATANSLVILDEIGRGTSTYDGMSLAQAILEYFVSRVKSYTLFATHYHELTDLAREFSQIINGHMSIHENRGELVFLRKLVRGPANRSYGIEVAKQAGLPQELTQRAQNILKGLGTKAKELANRQLSLLGHEISHGQPTAGGILDEHRASSEPGLPDAVKKLMTELEQLRIDNLTPLEALNKLSAVQKSIKENVIQ